MNSFLKLLFTGERETDRHSKRAGAGRKGRIKAEEDVATPENLPY